MYRADMFGHKYFLTVVGLVHLIYKLYNYLKHDLDASDNQP